ncbi:hypothetical protein V8F20_010142 [Naviculisporaceae sp. PSN 640]
MSYKTKPVLLTTLALLVVPGVHAGCNIPDSFALVSEPSLPDPWKFYNGEPVESRQDWTCRQEEIGKIFQQFELGDLPPRPDSVEASFEGDTVSMKIATNAKSTTARFTIRNIPHTTDKSGAPAVVLVGGYATVPVPDGIATIGFDNDACAQQASITSYGRGWFYDLHGADHSAGSLIAWSWCAGRIIDALEQLGAEKTGIDTKRLGVTGCSRNGKGAFVVGAFEKRFALTVPVEGGTGGAGSWRVADALYAQGANVQTARQLVTENTWMSKRFEPYVKEVTRIPTDHHFLPALVAPRGLFVVESNIEWLGPNSTTIAMRAGREIYAALGVKSNMGFYLEESEQHAHCRFPANAGPALGAFYGRFLQPIVDVEVSNSTVELGDWTEGWSPAPNLG